MKLMTREILDDSIPGEPPPFQNNPSNGLFYRAEKARPFLILLIAVIAMCSAWALTQAIPLGH